MVKRLLSRIRQIPLAGRLLDDIRFRSIALACVGLAMNLIYTMYNGALGIRYLSWWFVTMCAYYAVLLAMRAYIVHYSFRSGSRAESAVMRFCGGLFIGLAVVLCGIVVLSIETGWTAVRELIPILAIAAFTFWKAIAAIIGSVRVRRNRSPLLTTLRNIGCAEAAVSMLTLAHSMLSTFSPDSLSFNRTMEGGVGAGVFLIILGLGISMLVTGRRKGG